MKMKKIGLVGGTGPESTLMYYKELNTGIDEITHGETMPDIAVESVNFRRLWGYITKDDREALSDYLAEKVNNLLVGGAEIVSLTAATVHMVFDDLVKKTGADLISIPKVVSEEAVRRGYKKVGLLGTVFTMEQDYMKKDIVRAGIEIYVPEEDDRKLIGKRIIEELEVGIVKESTLKEFSGIIDKMKKAYGIEAIILGCTELPMILNDDNSPVPCLDSVRIHINKIIDLAMAD